MSILGFPRPAQVHSSAPRPHTNRSRQSRLRFATAGLALLGSLSCGQVASAVEASGPAMAQVESPRGPSPKVQARLLVAKGAAIGGVLGIAVQIGLAIGLTQASAGRSSGTSRRPDSSPRTPASRTASSPSASDAPVRSTRATTPAGAEYSDPQRLRRRKRRPGSRHTIVPKAGTPINISINTYPYYPTGAQPMPWQMPAEGFRPGIHISPSEISVPAGEPARQAADPVSSVYPPADLRPASTSPVHTAPAAIGPAFMGPHQRVPAARATDANSAVWEQGFERVHRPKPDQPNADNSKSVNSVEGMMQKIIAENLSLRG